MSHLADFFKNLFQGQGQGQGQGQTGRRDTAGREGASTLYSLIRCRRESQQGRGYYGYKVVHEYEVSVWQSGGAFTTGMRSQLRYGYGSGELRQAGSPWTYQKTSDTLAVAVKDAATMLADPQRWGGENLNQWEGYYWNQLRSSGKVATLHTYARPGGIDDGRLAGGVAAGRVYIQPSLFDPANAPKPDDAVIDGRTLPVGPEAGEVSRQLWGRAEPAARAAILQFVHAAPLTYGSWSHWKWFYKRAEEAMDTGLLAVQMARLDRAPLVNHVVSSLLEQPPSSATMAYMKRRARRYLRALAARDPGAYVAVASAVLAAAGRDRAEIDLTCQWISLDILYGASRRYEQTAHSRGRYVRRRRPSLLTRDKLAPEAWAERQDLLRGLYADATLPWQTLEWACALLLRRGTALPALGAGSLMRFLESSSPLLIRTAATEVAARVAVGAPPDAGVTALAFYSGDGLQRRAMAARLTARRQDDGWERTFATRLAELVGRAGPGFPRRRLDAVVLLGNNYASAIPADVLLGAVPALLATGDAAYLPLVRAVVARLPLNRAPDLLVSCESVPTEGRATLVDLLVGALGDRRVEQPTADSLVFHGSAWIREAGWRLLAADTALSQGDAERIWAKVLEAATAEPVLGAAIGSPDALRLLLRAPRQFDTLKDRFRERPALLGYLTPSLLAVLVKTFPLDVLVALIPLMDDPSWERVRDRLMAELRQDAWLPDFWRAVWALGFVAVDERVKARLLDDPRVAATFAEVAGAEFLDTSNAAFGALLRSWVEERTDLFPRGSRALLTAALSKLPELRVWALEQTAAVGMVTPFALRLLCPRASPRQNDTSTRSRTAYPTSWRSPWLSATAPTRRRRLTAAFTSPRATPLCPPPC